MKKCLPSRFIPAQQSTTRLLGDVAVDVKAGGVVRRLSKDRLTEIEELAMAIVLSCSPTMEKGYAAWHDADAEARHEKYLRIALDAAKGRALYESPRFAAIAVSAPANEPVH